jgi:hypothetical protein
MEVVTHTELADAFNELRESIEALGSKLGAPGDGARQEYFNRVEAAEYLRMGLSKLDDLTRRGLIRRAKIGDGEKAQVLYRRIDLDSFVEDSLEMDKYEARKHGQR